MESVRKERIERVKFILLVVAFVLVASLANSEDAKANTDVGKNLRLITLQLPDGTLQRFTSTSSDLADDVTQKLFRGLDIGTSANKSLCPSQAEPSVNQTIRQVEAELELSYMISSLKDAEKPRRLTNNQKNILRRTPLCHPYLADLKVIANLINGSDLVKMEFL